MTKVVQSRITAFVLEAYKVILPKELNTNLDKE